MEIKKAVSQKDFFMCISIRGQVFVDEQGVPSSIEIDKEDQDCLHYLALIEEKPVATLRAIRHEHYTKIGRIAVLKEYRQQGIGQQFVNEVMHSIQGEFRLGAQLQALPFYIKLGFVPFGDTFMEANIEHQMMKKSV